VRRERKIVTIAIARKLAVHLFWLRRKQTDYQQPLQFGSQGRKFEEVIMIERVTAEMVGSD
jgi:hypothetical protein